MEKRPQPQPAICALTSNPDAWIDEALAPLRLFVDSLAEAAVGREAGTRWTPSLYVERLSVDLPFEMDTVVADDGQVRLAAAPPTQYTETTFLPVFHRMTLTVEADHGNE